MVLLTISKNMVQSFFLYTVLVVFSTSVIEGFEGNRFLYVSPLQSISSCPGQPCHTLDYYATHGLGENSTGMCITMYFVGGIHKLSQVMNIKNLQCLTWTVLNSSESGTHDVVLKLVCGHEFCVLMSNVTKTVVEFMVIEGTGKFFTANTRVVMIQHVTFDDCAVFVVSNDTDLHSAVTVQSVTFFHNGNDVGQLVTCGTSFSSILFDGVAIMKSNKTSSSPRIEMNTPLLSYCDKIVSAVHVFMPLVYDVAQHISLMLNNVVIDHVFGVGISVFFPHKVEDLVMVNAVINNCSIANCHGAGIVWSSYSNSSLTLQDCNIVNNTHDHSLNLGITSGVGVSAAGLSIMSFGAPGHVMIRNCLFEGNIDLNYVVFVYNGNITIMDSRFVDNVGTAIYSYDSRITASGSVHFTNNSGNYGGALHLESSKISLLENSIVDFHGNEAMKTGGAIFVNNPFYFLANVHETELCCFYDVPSNGTVYFNFTNNTALEGGYNIYGGSAKSYCIAVIDPPTASRDVFDNVFVFNPPLNSSWSGLSSNPTRLCICDSDSIPQCTNLSMIFMSNIRVSPGEIFSIHAVLAGANFGTALGAVVAYISETNANFGEPSQAIQPINKLESCNELLYSIKSSSDSVTMFLLPLNKDVKRVETEETLNNSIQAYKTSKVPPIDLQTAVISLNVSLVPCPPGFALDGEPPSCVCYHVLTADLGLNCTIQNGTGMLLHRENMWIDISKNKDGEQDTELIFNQMCPLEFCNESSFYFDFGGDPDAQCAFNHAGTLCGGCREHYSLAIGSSNCIRCSNNNNLALLIFFAAAGLLLVILVSALNLTVTVGLFSGIIYYSNMVWTYKSLLFPSRASGGILFLKTFIAWINVDFGIETCFIQGLNAYWKTWLQFSFPFYIWFISGVIIVCCRYSTRMTKLMGNRAVPVLATLICLSYVKLLRTVIDGLAFSTLSTYPSNKTVIVWSLDGNLRYGQFPHILLLLAVLVVLFFLWIPYTVMLIFTQCFRKYSYTRICRCTMTYKPFFDCQFACLKNKHHYWHGILLLARGIHLVIFTVTSSSAPMLNLFLLQLSAMLFLLYEVYMQVYRSKLVQLMHFSIFLNLAILGGSVIFTEVVGGQKEAPVIISISVVFVQFWVLILWNIAIALRPFLSRSRHFRNYTELLGSRSRSNIQEHEHSVRSNSNDKYSRFRDSILGDTLSFDNSSVNRL